MQTTHPHSRNAAPDAAPRSVSAVPARRPLGMLGAIALATLLIGTGPTAFASHAQGQSAVVPATHAQAAVPPGDAAYLPASTVMFASVNPSIGGEQGKYLQGIEGIFQSEPGFSNAMKSITGANSTSCINVNNQVLSWVNGSITLGITSPSVFSSVTSTLPLTGTKTVKPPATQQGLALLFAVKPATVHSILAQHKLDALPGILAHYRLGTAKAEGSYSGVNLYSLQITACGVKQDPKSPAYSAIVGNEAVVTASKKDLQNEIDIMHGKAKSLATTASYQRLTSALPPTGLGYLYVDTPALAKQASGVASTLGSTTGLSGTVPSASGVDKALGPLGAVLLAQANGFRIQSVQLMNAASKQASSTITPNKGATLLTTGTIFYMSIGNLEGVITSVIDALKAAAAPQDAKTYDQLTASFSGVLTLLNGEFSIGLLPLSAKDAAAVGAGNLSGLPLAALFSVKDPVAAGTVVSGLLSMLGGTSKDSVLKPSSLPNGVMEYANSSGYGYATMPGWLVASTSIKNVVASIQGVLAHPSGSLASSSAYQQAAATLPKQSSATMYLDITAVRTLLEGLAVPGMSKTDRAGYEQSRPLLLPLKSLEAGTTSQDHGKTLRTDVFLLIGK